MFPKERKIFASKIKVVYLCSHRAFSWGLWAVYLLQPLNKLVSSPLCLMPSRRVSLLFCTPIAGWKLQIYKGTMDSTKLHLTHAETLLLNGKSSWLCPWLYPAIRNVQQQHCATCQSSSAHWPSWDMWQQEESLSPASPGIIPITKDKQRCFNNFFWEVKLSDFLKVKMKIISRLYTTLLASKDEIQVQPVTGNASKALPQLPSWDGWQTMPILSNTFSLGTYQWEMPTYLNKIVQ